MNYKSNVTIKSNVYVNKTKSQHDKDFVQQIRGYEALKTINEMLGTNYRHYLTVPQREQLSYTPHCSRDQSGDKPWGIIIENNVPVFVNRCEKRDCHGTAGHRGYLECSNRPEFRKIERVEIAETKNSSNYVAPDFGLLRYLDAEEKVVLLKTFEVSQEDSKPLKIVITPSRGETLEPIIADGKQVSEAIETAFATEYVEHVTSTIPYKKIDCSEVIISSGIEDRIIVNAGPGTGKTYAVIKRLGHIVNHGLADLTNVLILCYSRSAVNVIKKRIRLEIKEGYMRPEGVQLFQGIRTFDSFATVTLADEEFVGCINSLNYDERIERFITELRNEPDVFNGLEYLFIDEMQDLVGVRARMLVEILKQVKCGFLLLGDGCQAIYDYQIKNENEMNSYRFYQWLHDTFYQGVKKFELTKNVRQKEELAVLSEQMREAILSYDVQTQADSLTSCISVLRQRNHIGWIRDLEGFDKGKKTALLCRSNAGVSIISSELFAKGIKHRIIKRAQHVDLVPWIAKILSTYTESRIGYKKFLELALAAGFRDADKKWALLKNVAADDHSEVLDIRLLVKELVAGKQLLPELDLANAELPVISTIHRAKGQEYDEVLLLSDDYDRDGITNEEIKVAYVALTRGREEIAFCDKPPHYVRQLNSGRWIGTGLSKKGKIYCSRFEIGYAGDTDPFSFVDKNIEYALARQNYISRLRLGDPLEVKFLDNAYQIMHNDLYLGKLADGIYAELRDAMNKTNRSPNLPVQLSDIYVNNVVTIASTKYREEVAEPFNRSGLWLGVEVSGFAKIIW